MPETENADNAPADFLKTVRDITFIIAIYLYFAGWIYIYRYFDFFGLSIRQVDMDFYYFIVYSLNVLVYLIKHWFIAVPVLILAIALIRYVKRKEIPYIICIALFAGIYFAALNAAVYAAQTDMLYNGSGLKNISFVLKKEAPEAKSAKYDLLKDSTTIPGAPEMISNEITMANDSCALRLIIATKEDYFVIKADTAAKDMKSVSACPVEVYGIKKEDVKLVKLDN
jgi:hypothetical protein